jgi:hypothetical protein
VITGINSHGVIVGYAITSTQPYLRSFVGTPQLSDEGLDVEEPN